MLSYKSVSDFSAITHAGGNNADWFHVSLKGTEMTIEQIADTIAYCGLICHLCSAEDDCRCKTNNHCSKKKSPDGCFHYDCCVEKGFNGCWDCSDGICDKDMFAPIEVGRKSARRKLRAFITCIKEEGVEKFSHYIMCNEQNGVVYHRNGVYGDYDLNTEEEILCLLRYGERSSNV